ncbi:3-hydroxybutyryl-CoA dehydrogenase [Haloarcula hispanica N601]|uniref:3-hydroxybutyryl-CoA dehydrogenase n=3 Tax=Haloarcula hispanica TaxID=51589 RepID=V5TMN8_HALHI|nr:MULTISPECIES: 3-hydroxybutyryl-CoA dehydrogenase [Haloarcula]AEM57030.1 3-hydroxybutyryl-CoA dehydrogenase [Haloarcula hispanica ATCC 33960]AHB65819.1 3-hydroxybutyryl-CoA dehydrogenase [Haloarcula hispanica N601]AJF26962.1 3-hydroxybutyryl-CoA dehydrogenase [Haloarcula sp. CBA1115]KAA9407241.1 3-hydroxybutyryl-CoA dehydrogenase [Haloarcula sp. CBA1131]KAA9409722.1 3-hydroxybutyryl-CoA dehydrogenase [Haloarcula hispanica]
MHLETVDTVGVVGAGTMGNGIAQVTATAGYDVVMRDVTDELVAAGFEEIQSSFETLVARDTVTEQEAEAATARITGTTEMEDLADADLVVEAVTENMDIKQSVFEELDAVCGPDTVLASNTSTLSITTIASVTERPEQVLGLHFMNPVPIMKGVELVVGEKTSDETVTLGREFAHDIGKETWEADDKPGFVVNRVLMPWINEGIRAYDEGVADKADIDRGLTLGTNVPMGPLELADHIGLDVVLDASETLYEELGDRYKPAYLLKRKVTAGDLGKKSGRGFYDYD